MKTLNVSHDDFIILNNLTWNISWMTLIKIKKKVYRLTNTIYLLVRFIIAM